MAFQSGKFASSRRTPWVRIRIQLGSALILAGFLPWVIRAKIESNVIPLFGLNESLIATLIAITAGFYGFRRLSRYPGVRASYSIFPCFSLAYAAVLAIFFFLRLDYSRLHFIASFLVCIVWFYVVYFKLQRQRRLAVGIVPAGNVRDLLSIPGVDWIQLSQPNDGLPDLDAVVADLRADMPDDWERFLADRALNGMLVMHVKQMEESLTGRVAIEHLSENNLGSLIPGIIFAKFKRIIDIALALAALPVLLFLMPALAILIKLDSPGPVLFRQSRMGYRGESFTMYKFRTMGHRLARPDDERSDAMTRNGDDRITRVGRVLRQYRIDELPQIANVLRGEMSWIGPRPEAIPLSLWYERELPFYRYRHIVRPGITGWAQVRQGHVAEVGDVLWKLNYDFYYIKNFSFWLDLLIVAGTIRTIANGFGAR